MSLNNIELPDFVLTELYRNSLIAMDAPVSEKKENAGGARTQTGPTFNSGVPYNTFSSSNTVAPSNTVASSNTVAPSNKAASSNAVASSHSAAPSNTVASSNAVAPSNAVASSNEVAPSHSAAPSNTDGPLNTDVPSIPGGSSQTGLSSQTAAGPSRTGSTSKTAIVSSQTDSTSHTATPSKTVAPSPAVGSTRYKILGDNRKNITIVVQSPGIAFLPDTQLAFLTRMLEACSLNMGDVAIVNHAVCPVAIDALKQQLKPSVVLLFGMQPAAIKLPFDFPQFKIQDYEQCTYLYSSSLDELVKPEEESKLPKSKLWLCLKTIFGI